MSADLLLALLGRLTLLFSAGVLLLALLRPLLLRGLGAQATYLAWLLLPLLLAGPWLPLPDAGRLVAVELPLVTTLQQALPAAPTTPAASSAATAGLLAWAAGAALLAAGQAALQRRYLQRLRRGADGRWRAPAGASPAVVGLWPQRLVLPEDFQQRFDADARRLVLAHEAVHARRHDNAWNLLGAALLCLQWFNPLAWWAWARLRDDQELACDAAVLSATAGAATLAAYGRAMLAAHPGGLQPALASGWAARHPLVQRMRMLTRHRTARPWQRGCSLGLVLGLSSGAALLAHAQQPPPQPMLEGQALVFDLASQLGGAGWREGRLFLPMKPQPAGSRWGASMQAMQPGWCLNLRIDVFEDGSMRPTGQVLDEACKLALADWHPLQLDGSPAQLAASTARGPLQARVSARWMQPDDAGLPAQMKAELDAMRPLSPAQQQEQARQRERSAQLSRELKAQDDAWQAARKTR